MENAARCEDVFLNDWKLLSVRLGIGYEEEDESGSLFFSVCLFVCLLGGGSAFSCA